MLHVFLLTSFHCDVTPAQPLDGPFDCDVTMKKSANRYDVGPLAKGQLSVSLYMVMSQNVMYHLGEGDFIMFDEIPISTIKLSEGRFKTFNDISLSEELR